MLANINRLKKLIFFSSIGLILSVLPFSQINAETVLHTYSPMVDLKDYPQVKLQLVVKDFENMGVVEESHRHCKTEKIEKCYTIQITENGYQTNHLKYSVLKQIDSNTEILSIEYQSSIPEHANRTVKVNLDLYGYSNTEDSFLFKWYGTSRSRSTQASNAYLKKLLTAGKAQSEKGPFVIENSLKDGASVQWKKDQFWPRATLIRTQNPKDELSQVRVHAQGKALTYIFLRRFEKDGEQWAQVIEYENGIHVIDEFKLTKKDLDGRWVSGDSGIFRKKNFDNLWIFNDVLYYYIHNDKTKGEFKKYPLGSKEKGISFNKGTGLWKLNNPRYSNDTILHVLRSPDTQKTAVVTDSSLTMYWGPGTYQQAKKTAPFSRPKFQATKTVALADISDLEKPCAFIVGAVAWSQDSKSLFFDNSGICAACIYEIELETNTVTKIIPEHEAIHPEYFQWEGKDYIAYVEENQVKVAQRKELY